MIFNNLEIKTEKGYITIIIIMEGLLNQSNNNKKYEFNNQIKNDDDLCRIPINGENQVNTKQEK